MYAQQIVDAIESYESGQGRTLQSREGRLGPSDIGFCRQKAALITKGTEPTDNPSKWAAFVGSAVGERVEAAIKAAHPEWLVGSIDKVHVTATLPSGVKIGGHPDVVDVPGNGLIDLKTKDGLERVRKYGSDQSHRFQRKLYAQGCIEEGLLDPEKPIFIGNVYFDRSGSDDTPFEEIVDSAFDATTLEEIDHWIGDVVYSVSHGEDASRDVDPVVCRRICEFFTVCRGGLPVEDGDRLIRDQELIDAARDVLEIRNQIKRLEQLKDEASQALVGVNGRAGNVQVRWVQVNRKTGAFMRLDVTEIN